MRYLKAIAEYVLLCEYHKRRAMYAERHRDVDIPERYRTGEDAPTGLRLLTEILRLRR